jgi:hypothetical protein
MKRWRAVAVYVFVFVFAAGFVPACFAVDVVGATTAINQAEVNLNSAFMAVAEADGEGAYVENLLGDLEVAGDLLSEAHVAFRSGDYESAGVLATECEQTTDGVVEEASRLQAFAERTRTDTLLFTSFLSGLGLVVLLILGIIGWKVLKERYFERVLEMKPEVEEAR